MGLLDTETFELWMSKIMERFDRYEQMLSKLAGKEIKEVKYLDGERLLDNQDLCQLLQASKRSLQRYRSSGTLRYQMLWHKIYYKESDVQEFLKTISTSSRAATKSRKAKVERQRLPNGRHKLPRRVRAIAAASETAKFAAHQSRCN